MKFLCKKENLLNAVSAAARIISSLNTLPVLNNLHLKTDKGRLKISSTNLELALKTWVVGKVEEEGEITVPAKLINEYLTNLRTEKINLYSENQTLFIESDQAKTHINGLPAEEFPLIPEVEADLFTKIDGKKLKGAISEVVFAAAFSETQPEISGVLFNFEAKNLIITATDRYRLAEARIEFEKEAPTEKQIILPARTVGELGKLGGAEAIDVYISEGQIMFKTADSELISRKIEGQYPDYKQIIPTSFTTEANLKRGEFIQALKAASIFANENSNVEIVVNPQEKKVTIRSKSAQTGDTEISLSTDIMGQKNEAIFNYRYLTECLNNLDDDQVVIKLINSASPAALTPKNRIDYLYIVMPIKV